MKHLLRSKPEKEALDKLFDELFPITRSITGPGLRKSLEILKGEIPLDIFGVKSGTNIFDWEIPKEWHIHETYLEDPNGEIYADLDETNLSVVNYSQPVDRYLNLKELDSHLHTQPFQPNGFSIDNILFYHYHALPPVFENERPELFKELSLKLENPNSWKGYLMASAFVVEATKVD